MMGRDPLNQRDAVMRGSAVEHMKLKNLNEFKRQTYVKILEDRADKAQLELQA